MTIVQHPDHLEYADLANLYEHYGARIRAFITRITSDHEAAEDLCHDTFLKALRNWHRRRQAGSTIAWLYEIARNTAYDHLRRRQGIVMTALQCVDDEASDDQIARLHPDLPRAALALPSQDVGDLNIGSNILFLVLWILILLLIIKSFTRIVQIIILIGCAPIAGAQLMDRSTSSRFRSWFEKLIELLLAQINLAIIFIVITAILQPYAGRGAGDAFVSFLLSSVMMGMALSGKSVIGVAGAAMSGGGNGMLSFLKYQVVGGALRKATGGRGRAGEGYAATSTTDPHVRAGLDSARRGARELGERNTPASGDPAQSAAAQRQTDGTSSSSATPSPPAPTGSFQLGDAGTSLRDRRASV